MYRIYSGDRLVAECATAGEYDAVRASFREVNAAGGLVRGRDGKYLLIRRGGKWDLPKGHQEQGEDVLQTAVREVEEETGLRGLVPGELICVTHHCYERDSSNWLKHTWWYAMEWSGKGSPVPQTEEDITDVVWVAPRDLAACLENTYPSIREVFETSGVFCPYK